MLVEERTIDLIYAPLLDDEEVRYMVMLNIIVNIYYILGCARIINVAFLASVQDWMSYFVKDESALLASRALGRRFEVRRNSTA